MLPPERVVSHGTGNGGEKTTSRVHVIFAIFLATLAVVAGYLQYFAKPAHCWTPVEFTKSMVDFANSACYFSNSYFLPLDDIPLPEPTPRRRHINYYKWTPFGLLFLAALYVIPELVKTTASNVFRLNLGNILELSRECVTGSNEERLAAIKWLTADLQYRLDQIQWKLKNAGFLRCIMKISPSLPLYAWLQRFAGKLCFLIGSIVPIYFLYSCLGIDFNFYDQVVINKMPANETYFPDKILCDFSIRQLGHLYRYTVQCHLPANDMFKRISLLVVFLALVVSSVSSIDVISSLVARLFQSGTRSYVKSHMGLLTDEENKTEYDIFTKAYLGEDGTYLLWLIGKNSSETVVCEILSTLFAAYKTKLIEENQTVKPPPWAMEKTPPCGTVNAAFTHC